jgi:hypothetical protein
MGKARLLSICLVTVLASSLVGPAAPAPRDSAKVGTLPKASAPASNTAAAKPAPSGTPRPTAPAVQSPGPKRITEGQIDFCHVIRGCGLAEPPGYCPAASELPKPTFTFDDTRCQEARLLDSRGVTPVHPIVGYKLYRFLGMEYRVVYTVKDNIPISEARLAYLLNDLPLAARLVSHYRKEPYTAQYLPGDRTAFKGSKGKRLKGEARLISGDTREKRLFYFGYGVAEVALWKLKGPALMDFTYGRDPNPAKGVNYEMKLLVFPGNGVINSIMNLGLFRKVVLGKIKEVLLDITDSAKLLAAGGGKDLLQSKDWSDDEKKKIEEFLKLP